MLSVTFGNSITSIKAVVFFVKQADGEYTIYIPFKNVCDAYKLTQSRDKVLWRCVAYIFFT